MSTASLYNMLLPVRHGLPQPVETLSSPDRALGVSADRVKILQGRMFSPGAPGEAVIDSQLAGLEHLRPGGTLHLPGIPVVHERSYGDFPAEYALVSHCDAAGSGSSDGSCGDGGAAAGRDAVSYPRVTLRLVGRLALP